MDFCLFIKNDPLKKVRQTIEILCLPYLLNNYSH